MVMHTQTHPPETAIGIRDDRIASMAAKSCHSHPVHSSFPEIITPVVVARCIAIKAGLSAAEQVGMDVYPRQGLPESFGTLPTSAGRLIHARL